MIDVQPGSFAASQKPDLQTMQPMTVTNSGNSSLNWNIKEGDSACDSPADIPWLSVSPDSGSTNPLNDAEIDVTFDSAGLTPGDYTASLCVSSNDPATTLLHVPVAMTVENYEIYFPALQKQ